MKKIISLTLISLLTISAFATDYEIGTGGTTASSSYMPIAFGGMTYNSISQQLYFASELTEAGASAGNISAISFYYMSSAEKSRTCEVWIAEVTKTYLATTTGADKWMYGISNSNPAPGTKVFDRTISIPAQTGWYTITLDTEFPWGGAKNLIITINDKTDTQSNKSALNHKTYTTSKSTKPCGIYKDGASGSGFDAANAYNLKGNAVAYAPVIKFSISGASAPATPTGLSVAEYATSAYILWESVGTATSYKLQQSTDGTNWSELAYGTTTDPYHWTGLTPETTYYVRVAATNESGDSEYSDAVSFTTDALHIHDAITFDKWTTTAELPTSGNYYLANDVEISSITQTSITGSLNLCLNGHSVTYTHTSGGINITSTGSLTLYDPVGGSVITSPNGTATINVADGGSIAIYGGTVVNSVDATRAIKTHAHGALTLSLVDNASNSTNMALAINCGYAVNVNLARTWIADGYYSTLCLPFPLSSKQISSVFGAGTELATLSSSNLDGETINLVFATANSIQAGKPYLIKPANNAVNPFFNSVSVANGTTDIATDYVDFKGTLSPTYLESDEDILFLGAGNTLGWPLAAGNINGMRAYFHIHDLPAGAPALRHARFIAPDQSMPSALDETTTDKQVRKHMESGQLIIIRDGKRYNALGAEL